MKKIINTRHALAEMDAEGITTLTFREAGSLNILSTPVILDVTAALLELANNDDVRVLILRGSGNKAFVAGADITEMANLSRQTAVQFITNLRDLCEATRSFPTPVIARIPGWCLGGGLEFAMACDIRIASEGTQFGMPEVKVGIPSVIHATLMPRLLGEQRAAWLLLTGENISSEDAVNWALINEAVPLDQLDQRVMDIARKFSILGPAVLRQQKKLLRRWEKLSLTDAINDTIQEFGQAFETGEPQKYMRTFLEHKNRKKS